MKVLVLSPHPDDEAIGCGGSLLRHRRLGEAVRVIQLTSGELGGHGLPPPQTRRRREGEARRAAALLGVETLGFWRQPDGSLRASAPLLARLRRELLTWPAQRIYAPHSAESHTDHRAACRLSQALVRQLRREAEAVPELWLYEVWTPLQRIDAIVDIGAELAGKLRAIRAHRSQGRVIDFAAAARGLARYRGELLSWPEGDYAEVFQVVRP
jgi:LmbE family N-acetylglucosaminyl deacetylase